MKTRHPVLLSLAAAIVLSSTSLASDAKPGSSDESIRKMRDAAEAAKDAPTLKKKAEKVGEARRHEQEAIDRVFRESEPNSTPEKKKKKKTNRR